MPVHITWIFHASTEEQERGIASGHSHVGLSPRGIKEAEALAEILKALPFDAAYSSDLPRCSETARIALKYHNLKIVEDPRLREVDYGNETGKLRAEIKAHKFQYIKTAYPNGESYEDVIGRYKAFLVQLRREHDGQEVILCGHGVYPLDILINNIPVEKALFDYVSGHYRKFEL
jgi:broad specificity phosphatase PhoE